MGYLHRVRIGCEQITRTATISLVKSLYSHFTGILLGLPERKDLWSFQAPVIKLSKTCRVGFSGLEEIRAF